MSIDREVAEKVMGLTGIIGDSYNHDGTLTIDEVKQIPNYSTNIADAWRVVERMILNSWSFHIDWNDFNGMWVAVFRRGCVYCEQHNTSAPEAISRAALAAADDGGV